MIGELSSLFGKTFVVGHLVPSTTFYLLLIVLLGQFDLTPDVLAMSTDTKLEDAAIVILIILFSAVFLLAMNRPIVRLFEGYPLRKFEISSKFERKRYLALMTQLEETRNKRKKSKGGRLPSDEEELFQNLSRYAAQRFPFDPEDPKNPKWVLPTRFGNAMRSCEVYAWTTYGIDTIRGWPRLSTVIPAEYINMTNSVRSYLDLWINLTLVTMLFSLVGIGITVVSLYQRSDSMSIWVALIIVLAGGASYVSYSLACGAASRWGEYIKASFDVYLCDLGEKLGFAAPLSEESWRAFNAAIDFNLPDRMPPRHGAASTHDSGGD